MPVEQLETCGSKQNRYSKMTFMPEITYTMPIGGIMNRCPPFVPNRADYPRSVIRVPKQENKFNQKNY